MQPMHIPFLGHLIGLGLIWMVGTALTAWLYVPMMIVWWISATGVVVGILHMFDLTEPLRKVPRIGDPLMDLLDKYTSKMTLVGMTEGKMPNGSQKPEAFDVESIREALKGQIIGQDATIDDLTTTLRRRLAMMERTKPVAVLLFAGPPGVGKTELAKQMGKLMGRPFLFFDMSTCSDREGATTLFGSPKGYAGSDTYGQLTGGLRAKPNAIVLLDEIEKASPEVTTKFLTAWNDGFVSEASTGEKIPTSRAIFVMTTNAASKEIADLSKTVEDRDQRLKAVNDALKEAKFRPEVLSRIDRVFAFDPISGLDNARLAIVQIRSLAKSYGLDLVEDDRAIAPEVLFDVIERSGLLQEAGGVRAVIRALEEHLSDGMIRVKENGSRHVRVAFDEDEGLRVEAA